MVAIDMTYTISVLLLLLCTMAGFDLWRQYAIRSESYWFDKYSSAVQSGLDMWKAGYHLEDTEIKINVESNYLHHAYHILSQSIHHLRWNKDTHYIQEKSINEKRIYREKYNMIGINESAIVQIRCGTDGNLIKIGVSDFRTDPRDVCQIFTATSNEIYGPHYMFEVVPFVSTTSTSTTSTNGGHNNADISASNKTTTTTTTTLNSNQNTTLSKPLIIDYSNGLDYSFGLRSLSNGYYIKAVAPPQDNKEAPWKFVMSGSSPGFPELFRLSKEGYLFSPMIGGFLTCGSGDMLKGYSGMASSTTRFVFEGVAAEDVQYARQMVSLSDQILAIQSSGNNNHINMHTQSIGDGTANILFDIATNNKNIGDNSNSNSNSNSATIATDTVGFVEPISHAQIKICIAVPITSKGTKMDSIKDSPFWSNLFDSFMKSIDWRSNKYYFKFYLGFDKADEMYDTGDSWSELRDEFKQRATYRMSEQLIEEEEIEAILKKRLTVKLIHFDHLQGAPSQIVSQLVLSAYVDNFDYFYQVNDDTVIVTPNWAPQLIECLSPSSRHTTITSATSSNNNNMEDGTTTTTTMLQIPSSNFGVTGPSDSNNEKIFTHSFTHRTHVEVFGHLFPPSFKNWWSDDWISTVYGYDYTYYCPQVQIKHNVGAQKTQNIARYEVDKSAQIRLSLELFKGYVKINEWLKKNNYKRLALPNICGYIPLVRTIAKYLKNENYKDSHVEPFQAN